MSNSTVKVISNSIYPCYVTVFMGTDPTDVKDYFSKHCPDNKVVDVLDFLNPGSTIMDLDGDVWIYVSKDYTKNVPVLVHESFHATEYIMDYVGVKHSRKSSEAFAYLLQYIVSEILK
jgi:hypothetical protein